jgi:hypothetical protein
MAQLLRLRGASETVDFYDATNAYAVLADGHTFDVGPGGASRIVTIHGAIGAGAGLTVDQVATNLAKLRRLFLEAEQARSAGHGRQVVLESQPDGNSLLTTYDVLGGLVDTGPGPWTYNYLANKVLDLLIQIEVEPDGRGAEQTLLSAVAVGGLTMGLTHRYLHHTGGTVFSENLAALVRGSLWQSDKFTGTPTIQTPAASDALYFGNTSAAFYALYLGVEQVQAFVGTARWQYWNGSAWTNFVTTSTLRSTNTGAVGNASDEFKLVNALGSVVWDAAAVTGWATTAVNGVTGYWVRWTPSAITSMTPAVFTNGPARTSLGLGDLATETLPGDARALGKLYAQNTAIGFGDRFNDGSVSTALWDVTLGTNGVVTEQDGQLRVFPGASVAGNNYTYVATDATYNLTDSTASARVRPLTATNTVTYLTVTIDGNNQYIIGLEGGASLQLRKWVAGVQSTTTVTYNADTMRWWRIRHQASNDTIYWETSPDGQVWTVRRSNAREFAVTALKFQLTTGTTASVASPGTAHYDEVFIGGMSGVLACVAQSPLSAAPPAFELAAQAAIPVSTAAGLSLSSDSALYGQRVEVDLLATIGGRAQRLTGGQYMDLNPASGSKLDLLGGDSFFVEIGFTWRTKKSAPQALMGQWDGDADERGWWLGIDRGQPRFMASIGGSSRFRATGSTRLEINKPYVMTGEFDDSDNVIRVYLGDEAGSAMRKQDSDYGITSVNMDDTNNIGVGAVTSWSTSDSRTIGIAETSIDVDIHWIMIYADTVEHFRRNVLGREGGRHRHHHHYKRYTVPTAPREVYSSTVKGLWLMQDAAASTAIVDSSASPANLTRSSGNSVDNSVAGFFAGGVGGYERILEWPLPPAMLEEFAGPYQFFLLARPDTSTSISSPEEVEFAFQLSVGDVDLPFQASGIRFPDVYSPADINGWYLLPMGEATLPQAALSDLDPGNGTSRNLATASLFLKHTHTAVGAELHLAGLVAVPTTTWWSEWYAYRSSAQTSAILGPGDGLLFDARGSQLVVAPIESTTTETPLRNPYQFAARSARPLFHPKQAGWLYGRPLRTFRDNHVVVLSDTLTWTVGAMPRTRGLVAPA